MNCLSLALSQSKPQTLGKNPFRPQNRILGVYNVLPLLIAKDFGGLCHLQFLRRPLRDLLLPVFAGSFQVIYQPLESLGGVGSRLPTPSYNSASLPITPGCCCISFRTSERTSKTYKWCNRSNCGLHPAIISSFVLQIYQDIGASNSYCVGEVALEPL